MVSPVVNMTSSQTLSGGLPFDETAHVWSILASQLESFLAAWESGAAPPSVADFLPAEPLSLRRMTLVELIKADLKARLQPGHTPRPLQDYIQEFPELAIDTPLDLIYEEFQLRKQAGLAPSVEDYLAQYPAQATELAQLLNCQPAAHVSTSVFGTRKGPGGANLAPGDCIDDFSLLARLGQGAFACVFLARQNSMQRLVALKVSANRSAEPQTLAQLDNDHIIRVFDQRIVPEQGLRLMYMQYVSGGTLQEVVGEVRNTAESKRTGGMLFAAIDRALNARGESRPAETPVRDRFAEAAWPEVACWIAARLARGLDYAHRQGILHRDIKPANVLLTADGAPKLADFNISFSSKLDGASPAAYFGGSLAYMSPEQLEACNPAHARQADSLDGRSDLYSLGVLLWELLTGTRPFVDEQVKSSWTKNLAEMTARRQAGIDPQTLAAAASNWPAGLDQILLRCLDPDVSRRYCTGAELARQLELCLVPEARRILWPPANSWRTWGRHYGMAAVICATIAPNVVAAIFNYFYNRLEIIESLKHSQDLFWRTQLAINSVCFPLGMFLAVYFMWPVASAMARTESATAKLAALSHTELRRLRKRCLALGHMAAGISLSLWLLAAPAYPLALAWGGVDDVPASVYVHFVASLTLCGLIASAYPFFGVACLTVGCHYPAFARFDTLNREDLRSLDSLFRWTWIYLLLAASVPMLSVAILEMIGSQAHYALELLAVGGVAGLAIAFALFRILQADLAALTVIAAPPGEAHSSTRR
ncbi:MAG: pknB 29 [Planctomycetaceae bacterium]|nr:pknB 29 [Planctomycetaceae bacterium]